MKQPTGGRAGNEDKRRGGKGTNDARTRRNILETALEAFSSEGFEGASINEIARQNGISQALVHYHFSNKESLWKAAVDFGVGDMVHRLEDVMRDLQDADASTRLKFFIRRYINLVSEKPALFALIVRESSRTTDRSRWLTENYLKNLYGMFIELIEAGQAEGHIKLDLNPFHLAVIIGSAASQFILGRPGTNADYGLNTSDRETRELHANVVIDALFYGFTTAAGRPAGNPL